MSTKNTGGPAFPVNTSNTGERGACYPHSGMDLRDYLAAKAMQGIVAGLSGLNSIEEERVREQWQSKYPGKTWGEAAADQAYHIADAMIEAREQ